MSGYRAIDGLPTETQSHTLTWTISCTFGALVGLTLFTAAATKQINLAASQTTSAPTHVATAPMEILLQSKLQYRNPGQVHPLIRQQSNEDKVNQDQAQYPKLATKNHMMTAFFASLFSFFGVLTYLKHRDLSNNQTLAIAATTGVRPTMADTKLKFLTQCDTSIPNMYNIPLQELLAQHHLIRFNSKYEYNEVFALGIVTVVNQLLEGLPEADSARIQNAYFSALGDSVDKFKADAAELEEWASTKKDLSLSGDDAVAQKLKAIAARAASGDLLYSKFFSIGLFQLLQQSGQTDAETFNALVSATSIDKERVTKDLKVYKDLLKRLEMAKDMKEKFLERERKKQQERLEKKAQAA